MTHCSFTITRESDGKKVFVIWKPLEESLAECLRKHNVPTLAHDSVLRGLLRTEEQ